MDTYFNKSKINIILKSRKTISFLIYTKDKKQIMNTLIKKDAIKMLPYDYVVLNGAKGDVVINRSQIDAFTIEEIEERMEEE